MSKNISQTRITRLKELYQMSIRYSSKFGYIQFLKAAISTLRHEGLSIFSPAPKQAYIFDELIKLDNFSEYSTWLNKQKYFKNKLKTDFKKTLAIVIDLNENKYEKQKLENNIKNLLAYPNVKKIYVILSPQTSFEIFDERIELLEKSNLPEWSSINIDYFVFQKPNIIFNPEGILELLDYLEKDQDFDLLYSDEDRLISKKRSNPFFKPDWSPFLLLHLDFVSNFFVIPKIKLKINHFKNYFDLVLKITDTHRKIRHLSYPVICVYQ